MSPFTSERAKNFHVLNLKKIIVSNRELNLSVKISRKFHKLAIAIGQSEKLTPDAMMVRFE